MIPVSRCFRNKFLYIIWLTIDLSIDYGMGWAQTNDGSNQCEKIVHEQFITTIMDCCGQSLFLLTRNKWGLVTLKEGCINSLLPWLWHSGKTQLQACLRSLANEVSPGTVIDLCMETLTSLSVLVFSACVTGLFLLRNSSQGGAVCSN